MKTIDNKCAYCQVFSRGWESVYEWVDYWEQNKGLWVEWRSYKEIETWSSVVMNLAMLDHLFFVPWYLLITPSVDSYAFILFSVHHSWTYYFENIILYLAVRLIYHCHFHDSTFNLLEFKLSSKWSLCSSNSRCSHWSSVVGAGAVNQKG